MLAETACARLDSVISRTVIVEDLDVPGFIKRLNRNMKRVCKPKKVVERLTKKVKARKD